MQRSEERSGARKVTLGLCNRCLWREGIRVVRRNIQSLIKLSQRFGETAKEFVRFRVRGEQADVARVEPLGFVEVGLAPVPLASPPLQIRQRLKRPATIRQ